MNESYESEIFKQRHGPSEIVYEYEDLKSQELHPTYIVGKEAFTQAIFEEIADDEDEIEAFFTMMFFLGLTMIPLQLIFSDMIKPYDAYVIGYLQMLILKSQLENIFTLIGKGFVYFASMRFLLSFNVFFYLFIDPGVSYKVCLMSGCSSYIVFILKLIIHDARPYMIFPNIKSVFCSASYGCPSADIFGGMVYLYYLRYCIDRAINSDDLIVSQNLKYLEHSIKLNYILIFMFTIIGFFHILFGENFIYQILLTFFYMFIFIRILIVFNKEIDHISNGARFVIKISNEVTVGTFFVILTLALVSIVFYSIIKIDMQIPLKWRENINSCSNSNFDYAEVSLSQTLLESCAIFNILGATFGVNFVLKNMPNPYIWWISPIWIRLIRGLVGFSINYVVIYFTKLLWFKNIGADFILLSLIYYTLGFLSYGIIPFLFSIISFTNNAKTQKKIFSLIDQKQPTLRRKVSLIDEEDESFEK